MTAHEPEAVKPGLKELLALARQKTINCQVFERTAQEIERESIPLGQVPYVREATVAQIQSGLWDFLAKVMEVLQDCSDLCESRMRCTEYRSERCPCGTDAAWQKMRESQKDKASNPGTRETVSEQPMPADAGARLAAWREVGRWARKEEDKLRNYSQTLETEYKRTMFADHDMRSAIAKARAETLRDVVTWAHEREDEAERAAHGLPPKDQPVVTSQVEALHPQTGELHAQNIGIGDPLKLSVAESHRIVAGYKKKAWQEFLEWAERREERARIIAQGMATRVRGDPTQEESWLESETLAILACEVSQWAKSKLEESTEASPPKQP